jgi:endogenous inhibitor of DNA gyrase (YacG/DUF329 family)
MLERAHVRCPTCRAPVPAVVLWAIGDACPHCTTTLRRIDGVRNRPTGGFGVGRGEFDPDAASRDALQTKSAVPPRKG